MKNLILIATLVTLLFTSCNNDDSYEFNPDAVTMEAHLSTDGDNNVVFTSEVRNDNINPETATIEVWYHANDVYFLYTLENVTLNTGITKIGGVTDTQNNGVTYEISTVSLTVNGTKYKIIQK